jgi:hypothetical protein
MKNIIARFFAWLDKPESVGVLLGIASLIGSLAAAIHVIANGGTP